MTNLNTESQNSYSKPPSFTVGTTSSFSRESFNCYLPGFYYELFLDSFIWQDERVDLDPPLRFNWKFDQELFEITGEGSYKNILTYGESLSEALEALREEVLPIFWEDCLEDSNNLTKECKNIALDLKSRIK